MVISIYSGSIPEPGVITMADESRSIRIENLDELEKVTHKCTSTELLTEIQISIAKLEGAITSMAAASQELNTRFEEQAKEFRQYMSAGHVCRHVEQIQLNTYAISLLERERLKKMGSDYWVEKFVESLKYLILFVAGMFLTFILKGGSL